MATLKEGEKTVVEGLIRFVGDLGKLEGVVRGNGQEGGKFYVADYGLRMNPHFEASQHLPDRTIEDLQPTFFDSQLFTYHLSDDTLYLLPALSPVSGQGLGLKRPSVLLHFSSLRALAYSVLSSLCLGTAKAAQSLINPPLIKALLQDYPTIEEALELMMNLITIEELVPYFMAEGVTREGLGEVFDKV